VTVEIRNDSMRLKLNASARKQKRKQRAPKNE
jgi:hypothetical protein